MKAATIARIAVFACLLIGADSISFAGEPPSSERSRRRKGDDRSLLGLVTKVTNSIEELNAAPAGTPHIEEKRVALKQQAIDISAQAPESARVQAAVARAVSAAHDLPAAAKFAETAVSLAPQDPFPLVTRGLIRYKQGDYAAAAEDAKEALRSDPSDKAAFSLYRLSLGRAQGGAEAGGRAVPAGEPAPTEAQVFAESAAPKEPELGEIARLGRDRKKAAGLLEEALGAMRRGDPKRALELTKRAAQSDPSLADVYMNRALAHRLIGDLPSAQAEADKAVTLFTIGEGGRSLAAALALRAELKLSQGDAQGALSDAERALFANSKSAAALLYKARAAEKLGQAAAEVLAAYEAAAALEPSFAAEYEEAARRLGGGSARALPNKAAQDEDGPPWLLLLGAAALILMVAALAARKWIRSLTRS